MNAAEILEALRAHHTPAKGWVTVAEAPCVLGMRATLLDNPDAPTGVSVVGDQRIDLFALNVWPSSGHERVAYEIKVSRSDWLRELKDQDKSLAARLLANRFVIAAPVGLVKRSELPEGWGLVEVRDDGTLYTFRAGEHRDVADPPQAFLYALLRAGSGQKWSKRCAAGDCNRGGRFYAWHGGVWTGVRVGLCAKHRDEWNAVEAMEQVS